MNGLSISFAVLSENLFSVFRGAGVKGVAYSRLLARFCVIDRRITRTRALRGALPWLLLMVQAFVSYKSWQLVGIDA